MICRHSANDPDCSKNGGGYYRDQTNYLSEERDRLTKRVQELTRELQAGTPKPTDYTIERVERVGRHLVMMARYPSCQRCAYEGNKVMVFLNVTESTVIRWRAIDPHFRDPAAATSPIEAPSPAARFPATPEGWEDAISYAQSKP